jgi:hypothetical protein
VLLVLELGDFGSDDAEFDDVESDGDELALFEGFEWPDAAGDVELLDRGVADESPRSWCALSGPPQPVSTSPAVTMPATYHRPRMASRRWFRGRAVLP